MPESVRTSALGAPWRARAQRQQEQALPDGLSVVSCQATLGVGGLGRHVQEILDAFERTRTPVRAICGTGGLPAEPSVRRPLDRFALLRPLNPVIRLLPAVRVQLGSVRFDARAARQLGAGEHLIAFNGSALAQFGAARRARFCSLSLVSANSHMRRVVERHMHAYRQYPIERPWSRLILRRNLREYALADRIYVASDYIWESFKEQGFPDEALARFPLTPDPRYQPAPSAGASSTFDVVYVGSLLVHKGVPLLLDAFGRLQHPDLRLVLVGGWKTRAMRRLVQAACARDARIEVRPGDPLAHLQAARLCVHPAYEDGFAYAPAEALACGVPVLVSEDTGMKELIESERHGLVLPTGDVHALAEAIDAAYRGEILGG